MFLYYVTYMPRTYVQSIAEIVTFKLHSQLCYELRMIAEQADKETEELEKKLQFAKKLLKDEGVSFDLCYPVSS